MKPGHMGREHQEAFGEKTIRLKGKLVNHLAYPGGELKSLLSRFCRIRGGLSLDLSGLCLMQGRVLERRPRFWL